MNRVILIGNLCADPEAHTTQGGVSCSRFKVAVRRKFKNADGNYDADFLPVIAWRQTADFCNSYLTKGRRVAVEGSVQTRSYSAQDGSKRYVTEIIADSVEALDRAAEGRTEGEKPEEGPEDFQEVEDDDLPF